LAMRCGLGQPAVRGRKWSAACLGASRGSARSEFGLQWQSAAATPLCFQPGLIGFSSGVCERKRRGAALPAALQDAFGGALRVADPRSGSEKSAIQLPPSNGARLGEPQHCIRQAASESSPAPRVMSCAAGWDNPRSGEKAAVRLGKLRPPTSISRW